MKLFNLKDMKQYVEVISKGQSYSTHTDARVYGCTRYHHWEGLPTADNGDILEVVKEIIVNNYTPGYILRNDEGVEYIIAKNGVKLLENYKPMSKVEAPKTFAIKSDSKYLKQAFQEELKELGYTIAFEKDLERVLVNNISDAAYQNKSYTLEDYSRMVNYNGKLTSSDTIFTLPQDYNKAIEHAKEAINSPYWSQSKVKKMKFGSLEVEVEKGKGYVQIAEGRVTKEDLKKVIDWTENRPKILGYNLEISLDNATFKFGCKHGKYQEIKDIYEAI